MPLHGIMTAEERNVLASELAMLYLQKQPDAPGAPEQFAEKYLQVKQEIYRVLSPK